MEKPKFLSTINLEDYRTKNGIEHDILIKDLVEKGVFKKRSIKHAEDLKRLNGCWNGNRLNSTDYLFASIIYKDECYFLSDKYLTSASDFILRKAKNEGEKYLKEKISDYEVDEEGLINLEDFRNFYKDELNKLIKEKKIILKIFGGDDYDYLSGKFPEKFKIDLKKKLNNTSSFNTYFLTNLYEAHEILDNRLPSEFNHYKKFVYMNRLIEYVKNQLKTKDLKSNNIETFTISEAVCFLELIKFLKPEEIISQRKQAKIISKLIGKSEANIRTAIRSIEKKDKTVKENFNKIKDYLIKMEYPLE